MSIFSYVVWTAIVAVASYFIHCMIRATLARSAALQALIAWEEEVAVAGGRTSQTYSTVMPARQLVDDEMSCTVPLLERMQQAMDDLLGAPFHEKLRYRWVVECKKVEVRCNKAAGDLRSAAFWAQFRPGSALAEARFNLPINQADETGSDS